MKLYGYFCLLLYVLCSCADEPHDSILPNQEREFSLKYKIEKPETVTTYGGAVAEEGHIGSVLYLFCNSQKIYVGYIYRTGLKINGNEGSLPFSLPKKLNGEACTVSVITNLESYTDEVVDLWAERQLGSAWSSMERYLTTLSEATLPSQRIRIDASSLLMAGTVEYDGNSVSILKLKRKVVALDVSLTTVPVDVEIEEVSLLSIPINTSLLKDSLNNAIAYCAKGEAIKFSQGQSTRIYMLPNWDKKNTVKLLLKGKRQVYVDNGKIATNQHAMKIIEEDYEVAFPLKEPLNEGVMPSNTLLSIEVFRSLSRPDSLSCLMNRRPIMVRPQLSLNLGDQLLSCSENSLRFPFSSSYPLNDMKMNEIPNGSISREIFLSFMGNPVDFLISGITANWITVTRNIEHNSVVVTVEPNFEVNGLGEIVSVARKTDFMINFLGHEKQLPINVRQEAAPDTASCVTLDTGLTVNDRYMGATSNRFFSATTYHFWAEGSFYYMGRGDAIGDFAARGEYILPGTWGKTIGTHIDDRFKRLEVCDSLGIKCPDGYGLPSLTDLCVDIYPRLRMRTIVVNNVGVLAYYLTDGKKMTFIPLVGGTSTFGCYWGNTISLYGFYNPSDPQKAINKDLYATAGISLRALPTNNEQVLNSYMAGEDRLAYPIRCVKNK